MAKKRQNIAGNTTEPEMPLIMQAFMCSDNVIIKSNVSSTVLVNVITALLDHCTKEMCTREKVLKNQDDTINFLIGAYLISNRVYQDCVYNHLDIEKKSERKKAVFL